MDGSVGNILQPQFSMNGSTYSSNTIDNEWFKIYSGMDGSLGNILQTQLTISGSKYILVWMGL
jgi:hypothetical protein